MEDTLWLAARRGDVDVLRRMVTQGGQVNKANLVRQPYGEQNPKSTPDTVLRKSIALCSDVWP